MPLQFMQPRTGQGKLRTLVISYAPDWIVTIVLAVVFFALDKVSGFKRQFSVTDTSLLHPFAEHERVPDYALYCIAIVAPLVLQWTVNLVAVRSWWDAHNSALGVILGLSITGAITQFTKITVGRPRPDVISRCNPAPGTTNPPFGLSSESICHQSDWAKLNDGFRSFPSGHSSLSFAGLGFLSFYLAGKMHLFDKRGHAAKAWIALTPLSGAALVAISRTMDYRHHWHDVLVGSILGLVVSYFAYRQYYPPLQSKFSHLPYEPRTVRAPEGMLPLHHPVPSGSPSPSMDGLNDEDRFRDSLGRDGEHVEMGGTVKRSEPGPPEDIWKGYGERIEDPSSALA
ncbi:hypothetical protein EWM64_g2309 [Hericium alpestre]|uniref:Phosphatidic acid phosphatase type 2/haloperoxidase domain-containing protein n=1 Tax=Hericium alpestre TaxID=135208 RepID=A0A4Z0A5P2_9AGAM|nr:hypothetical protein EWM64_g2309 [Hericium alpestre]